MDVFQYISQHDRAIDRERSNLSLYRKTLDRSHLALQGKPVVFTMHDLSYEDWQEAMLFVQQPAMAADRAFRAGVVGIEGSTKLCDGGVWRPTHERMRDGEMTKSITVADMRTIFGSIAPRHILDVGQLLLERAEMERGEGNAVGGGG